MPTAMDVLLEAHSRVRELGTEAVTRLSADQLAYRPDLGNGPGNSIGWLVWHLTRQEDAQVAELRGGEQIWDQGWLERLALPYPVQAMGYGMSEADVARFPLVGPELLLAYQQAVALATAGYLGDLREDELNQVVDTSWDPPVTCLVRLVSIIDDAVQHAGQAAYLRGLLVCG